jgi:hypothetical protein
MRVTGRHSTRRFSPADNMRKCRAESAFLTIYRNRHRASAIQGRIRSIRNHESNLAKAQDLLERQGFLERDGLLQRDDFSSEDMLLLPGRIGLDGCSSGLLR